MEEIRARVLQAMTHANNAVREVSAVRERARHEPSTPRRLTDIESELLELAAAGLDEATAALQALGQAISERRERSDGG